MTDQIRVEAQVLRNVADQHDEVAATIGDAQQASADIHAAVSTYGPIMHQVKAAVADLLAQRDTALSEHATTHRSAADLLRRQATAFTDVDESSAERLRL
ncbi:type VII secretion target [Mycolicibacterium sp. BiH015]|uniref:type VII secretion target n=1 Tax=Mycolicibacterium sp. BiH015 TaxID=3018808 RepID=UPI0022E35136|nr:type VII secretion target [Mycolicibacterium sp. BiH015]MDA2893416.1 type VII secretion target [Mycolicibacterium sp. BiH015]